MRGRWVKTRIKRSGRRGRGDPPVATSVSLGKKLCPVLTNSRKLSVPTIVIVYTLPNDIANAIDTAPPHLSLDVSTVSREDKGPTKSFWTCGETDYDQERNKGRSATCDERHTHHAAHNTTSPNRFSLLSRPKETAYLRVRRL